MEEKALRKPGMVSRLPKFGARPQGGTTLLPNGTGHPLHCQEGKGAAPAGKLNGMVRLAPPCNFKWKKGGGGPASGLLSLSEGAKPLKEGEECRMRPQDQPSAPRELKKPSTLDAKVRRSGAVITSATSRTIPQPSKPTLRRGSTQNSLGSGGKGGLNDPTGRFGLGMRRVASNPTTAGAVREGLSQSSDSLKAPSTDADNMVRSQSFSHFKQIPSPTAQPIARSCSFSFNRATERRRPLSAKTFTAQGVARGGAVQSGKGPTARPTGGSALPVSLKKPLLSANVPNKQPTLAYKLTRPSLTRQSRPVLVGESNGNQEVRGAGGDSVKTSPVTPDPPSDAVDALISEGGLPGLAVPCDPESSGRYLGEAQEDMSLSSTSSLERNDTSEEYLDDFDNLGDGGGMLLYPAHTGEVHPLQPRADDNTPAKSPPSTPNETLRRSFLSDGVDWAAMGLTEVKEDSGGTYMWDEEGLEPLGTIARPCGSYDSDLNSLDILNNLDNLESCDLEDDDLMLDVDLPEDASLHSDADGMSHFERAERGGRHSHWRRRQHRWGGSDHFLNDNRGGSLQQFDGFSSPGSGGQSLALLRSDGLAVALDELTLSHMAEDCSSVKSQLLKLRVLLQVDEGENENIGIGCYKSVEDGGTIQDALDSGILSPEPREDTGSSLQVEELLREVEELREELRSKEETIALMTRQMASFSAPIACYQCQHRRPESRGEGRTNHDKATQTPWRVHGPPVLQPSSRLPSKRLLQERLTRTTPAADPSDVVTVSGDDGQSRDHPCPASCQDSSPRPAPGSEQLGLRLRPPVNEVSPLTNSAPAEVDHRDGRPPVLQSLRLHKKVSVPSLSQENPARLAAHAASAIPGSSATATLGSAAQLKKKQLPPPTRGLPCFGFVPQAPGLARPPTVFGLPRPQGPREPGTALPKAGVLPSPNHSRLPKPKIH
ncbi:hypothetical protein GJAV_G00149170 [Gymnothorax javanicus]|nr:hypothetical protein GJAV_G00149170 [Gymnothorax javanicus]